MHLHHSILAKLLLLLLVGIGICLVEMILIFQEMKEEEDDNHGDR
jgi:sensor domain CHASE-containing protein